MTAARSQSNSSRVITLSGPLGGAKCSLMRCYAFPHQDETGLAPESRIWHDRGVLRTLRHEVDKRMLSPTTRRVLNDRLTYLSVRRFRTLERLVKQIKSEDIGGCVVECGIALGGSAIVLTQLSGRPFRGYDVFGMIPAPSENDPAAVHERYRTIAAGESEGIKGDDYYGYLPDLYERVQATFADYGLPVDGRKIKLIKGLFEDTLSLDEPVALAHIDSDWHDSVKLCLERLWPQLSPGGFVVLDDYIDYGGCRAAADSFVATRPDASLVQISPNAVIRKAQS